MRRVLRLFEGGHGAALLAVLAAGLALRLWGISFGLPYRYHPDEPQHVAEAARMLAERRLEPEIFNNPPFYKYVLIAADGAYAAGLLALNRFDSIGQLSAALELDPSPLYLLGRLVSALAGAVTVLVTYFLGARAYGVRIGLIAAGFLAVTFLHVRESHYAVNDVLMTLLVAASTLGAVGIARQGARQDYVLAGVAAGLAFATKYTAAAVLLPVSLAHFLSPEVRLRNPARLQLGKLLGAWSLAAAFAVLGSPPFALNPTRVLSDIQRSVYSYGAYGFEGWQIDAAGGYLYYLKSIWWGLGSGLVLASAVGIGLALARRRRVDFVLLALPLLLYVYMGRQQMYFARFLLPALPAVLVLTAAAVVEASNRFFAGRPARASLGAFVLSAVVAAPTLAASVRHNVLLTRADTRTEAKDWVEANLPPGSSIALDWPHHGPPLSSATNPEPGARREFELLIVGGHGLADHNLDFYRKNGVEFLIAASSIASIDVRDPAEAARREAFYASLSGELRLIHVSRPAQEDLSFIFDEIYGPAIDLWIRDRPGPTLWIFQIEPAAADS